MCKTIYRIGIICLAMTAAAAVATAQAIQNPAGPPAAAQPPQDINQLRPNYVLGPNDQMIVRAFEVDEINEKVFKVEPDGTITLPLIGNIKASGLTVHQLELDIINRLKTLIKNPQVTIVLTQFRVDPVFFLGAFQKPGIYGLEGHQTLVDMLIKVGGLQPNASRHIKLTRKLESGPIPLPGAVEDPDAKVSSVEISIASLSESVNPAEDIALAPYDTITATRADKIYVQGALNKTGTLDLDERPSLSALQVITLSGGFTADADPAKAKILRPVLNTARRAEIPLDLKQVMSTKTNDYPLLPNDILFVPNRSSAGGLKRYGKAALTVVPLVTGIAFLVISRISTTSSSSSSGSGSGSVPITSGK